MGRLFSAGLLIHFEKHKRISRTPLRILRQGAVVIWCKLCVCNHCLGALCAFAAGILEAPTFCAQAEHFHCKWAQPDRRTSRMQSFRRHAGQYLAMLCNVLPLASVSPSALLHQGHSPVRMEEIATFSRWKSGFWFLFDVQKDPLLRGERAKKKRENYFGKYTDKGRSDLRALVKKAGLPKRRKSHLLRRSHPDNSQANRQDALGAGGKLQAGEAQGGAVRIFDGAVVIKLMKIRR
jgi:hypothetical protein